MAREIGVGSIHYKDEGSRFGLGSFKALGGAYGVLGVLIRAIERESGEEGVTGAEILAGLHRKIVSRVIVTCATAGNHGRSVAWGAELFGCRSVVFLPVDASPARAAAIEGHGATVVRTESHYDAAVVRVRHEAERRGWEVVSDTSYPGYTRVPRDVMHGYTVMVAEALDQLHDEPPPTHVFVQAGVGGLSTAVCGHLWERQGARRPWFVLVEPEDAACFLASARRGARVRVEGPFETAMGGLASGEPSLLAWRLLSRCVDAYLAIADAASEATMRWLAGGVEADPPIVAGVSGAAGLAGLLGAAQNPGCRERLGLGESSRALVFGTEGATDPDAFARVVGASP